MKHPITGEEMAFLDPLPQDLAEVLDEIKEYSSGRTEKGDEILGVLDTTERNENYGY